MRVSESLELVREKMARAAERAGRRPGEVTLVAVTKTVPPERIMEAIAAGVADIGENRVQEALAKRDEIRAPVRWHMVGHLQRNKVKYVLGVFDMLHSLDRLSLAEELNKRAQASGKEIRCLVQVNVAGESTRHGVPPDALEDFLYRLAAFPMVRVQGLMTMAPFLPDPEETRPSFRRLRLLSERVRGLGLPGVEMRYLSMGMSNDYEVAIEEGSNMVRIGTAIFGERG